MLMRDLFPQLTSRRSDFFMKRVALNSPPAKIRLFIPALGALLLIPGSSMLYAQAYTVKDLGTLGGHASFAYGINNAGQVIGSAGTANGQMHATVFSGTGSNNTDLGTLGGTTSAAFSINDNGQIVGEAFLTNHNTRAVLFSGTGSGNINLGNLGDNVVSDPYSVAYSINRSGQVVGYSLDPNSHARAVLFSGTGSGNTDLGTLGGSRSSAFSINDSGKIAGYAASLTGFDRAALFSGTGSGNQDLGALGGVSSYGFDMNESGKIVGSATDTNGDSFAALYSGSGSGAINLGTLGGSESSAFGINKSGQIVGNSLLSDDATDHAFIYNAGTMRDLNDLIPSDAGLLNVRTNGWHAINDRGQIAAVAEVMGGEIHAILLTPAPMLGNISTRLFVQTGDNVLIGGLIVSGTGPKKAILRALGPTLTNFGITNALGNPVLELRDSSGALITSNDNWGDAANKEAIIASGLAPPNTLESAILTSLSPGNYSAVVRGANNATGVALVEVYDLDSTSGSKFGNISTRGFVQTGSSVMIAGLIVQGQDEKVIIRGLGPTLSQFGVPTVLADPTLELRDSNGTLIRSNDNWKDTQQAQIQASGYAPPHGLESALAATLAPSSYTAILRGKNNTSGNALVEVYEN